MEHVAISPVEGTMRNLQESWEYKQENTAPVQQTTSFGLTEKYNLTKSSDEITQGRKESRNNCSA